MFKLSVNYTVNNNPMQIKFKQFDSISQGIASKLKEISYLSIKKTSEYLTLRIFFKYSINDLYICAPSRMTSSLGPYSINFIIKLN